MSPSSSMKALHLSSGKYTSLALKMLVFAVERCVSLRIPWASPIQGGIVGLDSGVIWIVTGKRAIRRKSPPCPRAWKKLKLLEQNQPAYGRRCLGRVVNRASARYAQ